MLPKSALFGFEYFKTPNKPLFFSLKSLLTMAFQKLNCEGGSKTWVKHLEIYSERKGGLCNNPDKPGCGGEWLVVVVMVGVAHGRPGEPSY